MYSVIIPSLGRIDYLNELLQSIYNQTLLPKEIIILLDQNEFCKNGEEIINKKDICKIIFCKELNLSQKRNFGSEISNSQYIIFSDDDDVWEPNKAELTLEALKNSQLVCHEFYKFGHTYQKPKFLLGKEAKMIAKNDLLFGSNVFGGGTGIAGLKEIFLSFPFDTEFLFCEDFNWWTKVVLAEIRIKYIPIPLVKYRTHNKNMTSNFLKIYLFNLKIFKDLFYKSLILFFASFFGFFKSTLKFFILLLFKILFKTSKRLKK